MTDLDDLEAVARAATEGPWHWVNCETDEPSSAGEVSRSLRTTWERPAKYVEGMMLPEFILSHVDYERDSESDATHIATFDPPTVLDLIARLRKSEAAVEAVRDYLEDNTSFVQRVAVRDITSTLNTHLGDTP